MPADLKQRVIIARLGKIRVIKCPNYEKILVDPLLRKKHAPCSISGGAIVKRRGFSPPGKQVMPYSQLKFRLAGLQQRWFCLIFVFTIGR